MKTISVLFILIIFSTASFGQKILLAKIGIGDTIKIIVSQVDEKGNSSIYDSLSLIRSSSNYKIYSKRSLRWYCVDKTARKKLKNIENRALLYHGISILPYEVLKLTKKNCSSSLYLRKNEIEDFIKSLEPMDTVDRLYL